MLNCNSNTENQKIKTKLELSIWISYLWYRPTVCFGSHIKHWSHRHWSPPSNEDSSCGSVISWDINHWCRADICGLSFPANNIFFSPFYVAASTFLPPACLWVEIKIHDNSQAIFKMDIGCCVGKGSSPARDCNHEANENINLFN